MKPPKELIKRKGEKTGRKTSFHKDALMLTHPADYKWYQADVNIFLFVYIDFVFHDRIRRSLNML
jgi:hypothetical protein